MREGIPLAEHLARSGVRLSVPVRSKVMRRTLAILSMVAAGCALMAMLFSLIGYRLRLEGAPQVRGVHDAVLAVGAVWMGVCVALFWLAARSLTREGRLPWLLPLVALAGVGAVWAWGRAVGVL